jgi:hypothetical protein
MIKLSLPVPGIRRGLVGSLPVGPEYMAGVRARARMLAKACRFERHDGANHPGADPRQGALSPDGKK